MTDEILHKLTERIKELTALHMTARILQDETKSASEMMADVVALLPPAWQYPEITTARIRFQELESVSQGFAESEWKQSAIFTTRRGETGSIEVYYRESRPTADEGPFLKEERDLIESLAEMLRSYFQHLLADDALRRAHDDLERLVADRTAELRRINAALEDQIAAYRMAERKIDAYQMQLRQLASELSLAEARERKAIAEDLHDHIGQALALIKMSLSQFRGNAIFCGFEDKIDDLIVLLDQTIRYTRNLTFEISPPALYELGLEAAVESLVERFRKEHGIAIQIESGGDVGRPADDVGVILYKSVQELLTNVIKHAHANRVAVRIGRDGDRIRVEVEDDGCGFDPVVLDSPFGRTDRFGLFNIRERLYFLGGVMEVRTSPGEGTVVILTTSFQP